MSIVFSMFTEQVLTAAKCSKIVEKAYQQTKNFDRLSFLYVATGSTDKLIKMQKIAEARGDPMSRFHNALYANDVLSRIAILRDVGLCMCTIVVVVASL